MVAHVAGSGEARARGVTFTPRRFAPMKQAGMDQTFNFRAARVPLRRRLNPRLFAYAVAAVVVLFGLVSLSLWVVGSERRSIERAVRSNGASAMVGTIAGSDDVRDEPSPMAGRLAIDATARADARIALVAARRAAAGSATFLDAGPGQLGATGADSIFVDGPSQAPGVVSVASTRVAWGAAVMGPSGTCYLLRFAPGDGVTYGAGWVCTGAAALEVHDPTW